MNEKNTINQWRPLEWNGMENGCAHGYVLCGYFISTSKTQKMNHLYAVLTLLSSSTLINAQINSNYRCDPNACKLPSCYCPSQNPPGNLSPKDIPQFMTLTYDDSVNDPIWPTIINTVTNDEVNPNGCPISATFFVSIQYTDYYRVQSLYNSGHEIGTHTMTHVNIASLSEIAGAPAALNAFSGIPRDKLSGFRQPFLNFSTDSFRNLQNAGGFLYDSSMVYNPAEVPYWPHTLDYGSLVRCEQLQSDGGTCFGDFRFPGLWEVPLYALLNDKGGVYSAMDPVSTVSEAEMLDVLKKNFLMHYNGNRLPMGLYFHAAAEMNRVNAIKGFISWTLKNYPDVYWVNNQQLISWIKNPTNIKDSLKNSALSCLTNATHPSNPEICDGIDNNGNGIADEPISNCGYPDEGQVYFKSCMGCPVNVPSIRNPVPAFRSDNRRSPVQSCIDTAIWDPVGGKCVPIQRLEKPAVSVKPVNPNDKSLASSIRNSIAFGISLIIFLIYFY